MGRGDVTQPARRVADEPDAADVGAGAVGRGERKHLGQVLVGMVVCKHCALSPGGGAQVPAGGAQ